jgi:hypothetical protein
MRLAIIIALCIFWIVLAVYSYKDGNKGMAAAFLFIGFALTGYRLLRWRS